MENLESIQKKILKIIHHNGRTGRKLRILGYVLQFLSITPILVLIIWGIENLTFNETLLIKNIIVSLSYFAIWLTIWNTGKVIIGHGNTYGLRGGQFMDLYLYYAAIKEDDYNAKEVIWAISELKRMNIENQLKSTIDESLIKELLAKLPGIGSVKKK